MRHGKKINHLGRTSSHRRAMLANMANSLILHKRIMTTTAKAKALRKYVEPLLTKAKDDTTHSRRTVFAYLQDKEVVQILFSDIASKISDRPGGYTRIIKTGNRLGDSADMCMMELVDYNELMLKTSATKAASATKAKRTRRSKKTEDAVATPVAKEEKTEAKPSVDTSAETALEGETNA